MRDRNGTAMVVGSNGPGLATTTQVTNRMALEPTSITEGMQLAEVAASSHLFGIKTRDEAFVRMATGMALGLSAWQSLRGLYVINGKVGIDAALMHGLCLLADDCEYFRRVSSDTKHATFTAKRKRDSEATTISFTMKDAEDAGLTKNPVYRSYPARMLEARCKAILARLVWPEKMHGLYDPGELHEIDNRPQQHPRPRQIVDNIEGVVLPESDDSLAPDPADAIAEFQRRFAEASTRAEVMAVSADVGRFGFSDEDKTALRTAKAARLAAIEPEAAQ